MCCVVLPAVINKGYLSIQWFCFENAQARMINLKFNPHIYLPSLTITVPPPYRAQTKEGNYEEIKWETIVRCPSTSPNNMKWHSAKKWKNTTTELLFCPRVKAYIKMTQWKSSALQGERSSAETACWLQKRVGRGHQCSRLISVSPVPFICSFMVRSVRLICRNTWDKLPFEYNEPVCKRYISHIQRGQQQTHAYYLENFKKIYTKT